MKKVSIIFSVLTLLLMEDPSLAFDDADSHPRITKSAITSSSVDSVLKDNLGITEGINKVYKNNNTGESYSVFEWLWRGSKLEDSPACRAQNHFHNPLKPWYESYMTDEPWYISTYCFFTDFSKKYSNVTWATGKSMKDGSVWPRQGQDMGWDDARYHYYYALISASKTDRENNFAKTFQALGQVMHLLQDVSVPAHTRNDFMSHLSQDGLLFTWVYQPFEYYVKSNPSLVSASSVVSPSFTNPRHTDFWDTDQYPSSIGLAEFSNANYFSDSTIPTNNPTSSHIFSSPKITSDTYQICEDYMEGSGTVKRKYVSRKDRTGCDHFAAVSALNPTTYMDDMNYLNANISNLKLWLDDNVHNTYANDLIPRAVGYSAGLLNYFFRGEIDLIPDDTTGSGHVIENKSSEDMEGTFELWYDDTNDNRKMTWSSYLKINANSKSTNITFSAATDAKEPDKYMLVFKGKLGNEEGAVVGKSIELEKEYIFLVNLNKQQAVFEIEIINNNYELIPIEDINIPTDYITSSYNAAIQSTPDNAEHVLSYPGYCSYKDQLLQYGVIQSSTSCHYGAGLVFRPQSFTANSSYEKDYFHENLYQKDGNYQLYAFGRNNYTLDSEGKMISYDDSIWKNTDAGCSSNYVYRYKTEQSGETFTNGEVVAADEIGKGTSLYIPGQGWTPCSGPIISNEIIAAMGNGKALYIEAKTQSKGTVTFDEKLEWPYSVQENTANCKTIISGKIYIDFYLYESGKNKDVSLKLGMNEIASVSALTNYTKGRGTGFWNIYYDISDWDSTCWSSDEPVFDPIVTTPETIDIPNGPISYIKEEAAIKVLDYDSVLGDDAFIIFYLKSKSAQQSDTYYSSSTCEVDGSAIAKGWRPPYYPLDCPEEDPHATHSTTTYTAIAEYNVTFKTSLNSEVKTVTIYKESTDGSSYNKILTGFSTQMNKDIIVYTYVVKKLSGATYVFDKRIVGIINISDKRLPVGYTQEFEITNTNSPTMNFDYTQVGAIGIHK